MKEFIEKLNGRLGEQQAEAENEMHRLRSGDYTSPCSYDITDIKEIASESFKESIQIVNQLAEEYKDDEEQGLLLRLPCKVGDTVYCFGFGGEIIEGVCKAIQINEKYKMVFIEGKDFCFWKMFEKFGKTVFLTKEEAEQALKQKGE